METAQYAPRISPHADPRSQLGAAVQATGAAPLSLLDALGERINHLNERLHASVATARERADSLIGSQPEGDTGSAKAVRPEGRAYALRELVEEAHRLVDLLSEQQKRLYAI